MSEIAAELTGFMLPAFGEPGVSIRMREPRNVIDALAHDVKLSGMSIRQIADKCAVSESTIRRALHPSARGKVTMLMRIAWAIGRDLRISFSILPDEETP